MKSKVNIIPFDSKLPNVALEKVRMFFEAKGHEVICDLKRTFTTETWVSVIFTKNRQRVADLYEGKANIKIGGSGWDLSTNLPPEIECLKPRINYGFTSRGCLRKCAFCVVPVKEGSPSVVGDVYDLWDRKAKLVTIIDNNILALPEHFKLVASQLIRENLSVDFNQGLDIRLVTDEVAYLMSRLSFPKFPRFSLDHPSLIPVVREKLSLLRKYKPGNRYCFYVLCGFETTFEEDMARLNFLRAEGVQAFLMRYEKDKSNKLYNRLASWVNSMAMFRKYSFEEYLALHDTKGVSPNSPLNQLKTRLKEAGWLS